MSREKPIYVVYHSYEIKDHEEARIIGIFSSARKANEAIKTHRKLPGFNAYPNGFIVEKHELEKQLWKQGFITTKVGVDLFYSFSNEAAMDQQYGKGNWSKRNPIYTQLRRYRDL